MDGQVESGWVVLGGGTLVFVEVEAELDDGRVGCVVVAVGGDRTQGLFSSTLGARLKLDRGRIKQEVARGNVG